MTRYRLPLSTRLARVLRHPFRSCVFALSRWCDKRCERWARAEWERSPIVPKGQEGRHAGCDPYCEYCGYLCRCGRPL
jgi:hypothetical protein